jgi:hypothetical protein
MTALANGLANQIATQTGILRAHGYAPGQIVPPAVVVIPGIPAITYGVTMDGETTINLRAIVLLSAASDDYGQKNINSYVSSSGTLSILAAVNSDVTVGGLCEFAEVINVTQYGFIDYAGQQFFGATFAVQVGAHL